MRAKKSLGQHFLADPHILARIADALDPGPGDVVVEIGPGPGTLTRELARRGPRVVAIEKDRGLAARCAAENAARGLTGVEIVTGDALALDWHALAGRAARFLVCGNIPYRITSPLIERALAPPYPARIVFLVQKEVAERVAAAPGSGAYGALSVGVQAVCVAERLFTVRAGAFRPPPRVDSAVLRLVPRRDPLVAPEEAAAFRRFVTACFGRRRKQMRNALAGALALAPAAAARLLEEAGVAGAARPETLAPETFAGLWRRSLAWEGDIVK